MEFHRGILDIDPEQVTAGRVADELGLTEQQVQRVYKDIARSSARQSTCAELRST